MSKIIILSGPSRGGKDTIVSKLRIAFDHALKCIVTYTTRPRRETEIEGVHHFFVSKKIFQTMIRKDQFLEWVRIRNSYFGTSRKSVEDVLSKGLSVLLKIDVQGMPAIKKQFPNETVTIFLKPESINDIKKRLTVSGFSEIQKKIRLKEARREIRKAKYYDYIIVNRDGKLNQTVQQALKLIKKILKNTNKSTKLNASKPT